MRNAEQQESQAGREDQWHRLDWLSQVLDSAWVVPGTSYRIGLDGILGLIPGIGDPLGTMLSSYLIFEAARMGAPAHVLLRMVGNVAVESMVGVVPILGDIFDFAWKANVRNLTLLRTHKDHMVGRERSSRKIMMLIFGALLFVFLGLVTVSIVVLRFLYQLVTA